jgi:glycosyltransferase involved in cell wall biosynthesis
VARLENAPAMRPLGTVFFSGPNFATEVWRREVWGMASYSVCGITHTISTKAVMEGAWHLRASPQAEWDAVICTSRAVKAAVSLQMDLIDDFLLRRFGGQVPPRPQLPVIPLGVDCDEFLRDPAAGTALRAELGISAADSVALIVARLSPHEKFDPLPVYLALQRAQAGTGRRLHLILYGNFPDSYSQRIFLSPARELMPDVTLHHLPHEGAARRLAAFSAAEMFLFPIDNLQESFGIAPVEAMAAGLPVVASDWDGIRDTVGGGAGFRIPTTGARPEHVTATGLRYHGGTDNYIQYLSQLSAVTQIDIGLMAEAVRRLMQDGDLRAQMGAAGQARARALFDWQVVIPAMQDLFAELDAIRRKADPARHPPIAPAALPVAPSPMVYFGAFPTEQLSKERRFRWSGTTTVPVRQMLALRDYPTTKRIFEMPDDV